MLTADEIISTSYYDPVVNWSQVGKIALCTLTVSKSSRGVVMLEHGRDGVAELAEIPQHPSHELIAVASCHRALSTYVGVGVYTSTYVSH